MDVEVDDEEDEDADVCAGGGELLRVDELELPDDCCEDCCEPELALPEFAGAAFGAGAPPECPAERCSAEGWLECCVCCCEGRCADCCRVVRVCGEFCAASCAGGGVAGRWMLRLFVLLMLPVLLFWDCGVCAPDCVCGRCVCGCV